MEGYTLYLASKLQETKFGKQQKVSLLHFKEIKSWPFWRAVLAEFLGTLLFVFLGCLSAVAINGDSQSTIKISLAFGLTIMAMIQMFGPVSGGHFNPAVSIGLAVALVITPVKAFLYVAAQSLGAVVGAFILKGVSPNSTHHALAVTAVNPNLTMSQGVGVEVILTFVLVFVILATTEPNRTDFGSTSLKIGLTVGVMHLCGIDYTGSSMNPARSLGSAVASENYHSHWVYWVGPIVGGILAAILYKYLFNPYRGIISTTEAIDTMLHDGSMISIPRTYFKESGAVDAGIFTINGSSQKSPESSKLESLNM